MKLSRAKARAMRVATWSLMFAFILQCAQQVPNAAVYGSKDTNKQTSNLSDNGQDQVTKPKKKIDVAKQIRASNLVVSKLVDPSTGATKNLLSFDVSGDPDYFAYQICPTSGGKGDCLQKTTILNKALLAPIFGGEVTISIKGCVDSPDRAINPQVLCGAWNEITYESQLINEKLATLTRELEMKKEEIGDLAIDLRAAFQNYVTDAEQCQITNTEAYNLLQLKVHIIKSVINAPLHMMKDIMLSPLTATQLLDQKGLNVLPALGQVGQSLLDASADKVCQGNSGQSFCSFLKNFAAVVPQFLEGMNPATTMAPMASAIMDLTNPEASVVRNCLAEKKLSTEKGAVDLKKVGIMQRIKDIQCEIDSLSGASISECAASN